MSELVGWEVTTWGTISDLRYGKALRDYRGAGGDVPVFGTNGPVGLTDSPQCRGPGVIIGRKGAYRGVHYSELPFWVIDTAFYLAPKSRIDMRWAYYSLQLADINGLDSGSAIPSTTRESFGAIAVLVPPLPEQQAIAEVLGALDDKIAANTALATAADRVIRAEYEKFETTDMRIGHIADSPRVGVAPSSVDADELYVGLEHVGRRNMWLTDGGTASDISSGKSAFAAGDVLFGKLRPYFHKVVLAPRAGICSTDILVVRPRDAGMTSVLLAALTSDAVIEQVVAASEGTRMPRTSWKDLSSATVRWPRPEEAAGIASRLDSICRAVTAAVEENRTLAATRDALLPQLMSGKLRVRDAEAAASAVL
ncbi:restriction endonuclease subunit S [Microbacterium lacticum]